MVVGVGVGVGFDCYAVLFGYFILFLSLEFLVCEGVSQYGAGLNCSLAVCAYSIKTKDLAYELASMF